MTRWAAPGIPFLVSLALSAATVGAYPYWQDSALYLTAVKDLGVLYPPGFVLYELLCRAWTQLLFFVDFTLAVHLFSSFCAALSAGVLALAIRDALRSRGPIFGLQSAELPAEGAAIVGGLVLASGYTFCSTAIYAKGYALYYLLLALLLWRLIRADEDGRGRDWSLCAALMGLAWQAHPSAALGGLALAAVVATQASRLGVRGIAGRVALAAACALGPALLALPVLLARDPWLRLADPRSVSEWISFLLGQRYLEIHGVFGPDARRFLSFPSYLWEEFLGVGLVLAAIGIGVLVRRRPRLSAGFLLWTLPYALVTILFKIEGQHDCWFIAAWFPLYLACGVGAAELARRAGARAAQIGAALAIACVGWSIAANLRDLSRRNDDLAELYGRTILEPMDRDAVVVLSGDEGNVLPAYLQRVRGLRPDVALVMGSFLSNPASSARYLDRLLTANPTLKRPDLGAWSKRFPNVPAEQWVPAAFLNENAESGRPLFSLRALSPQLIRPDFMMAPAGVLWKLVPRAATMPIEIRYWQFPIEPEAVVARMGRARGQNVESGPEGVQVTPEPYERRLVSLLIQARFRLSLALTEHGQFLPAAKLCESILAIQGEATAPEIVHHLAISYYAAGESGRAEPLLKRSSESRLPPENRASALFYLGEIAGKRGDGAAAQGLFRRALEMPGLDAAWKAQMELRVPR